MPVVLAKKQIGRVRPGEKVKVGSNVVRAVLALGMAERIAPVVHAAPVPAASKLPRQERRAYNRKDVPASPQAGVMTVASGPLAGASFVVTSTQEDDA